VKLRLGLVCLLALTLVIGPGFSGVSGHIDSVSFDKQTYEQGSQGKCTLTLSDPFGDTPIKITRIELKFDFGTTVWTGEILIEPGETKTLEMVFTIPEDTDDGEYTFSIYFEFYKREGNRWRWVPPGGYGPTGEKIAVRKPFRIPGYPWESVILGFLIGTAVLLISREKRSSLG